MRSRGVFVVREQGNLTQVSMQAWTRGCNELPVVFPLLHVCLPWVVLQSPKGHCHLHRSVAQHKNAKVATVGMANVAGCAFLQVRWYVLVLQRLFLVTRITAAVLSGSGVATWVFPMAPVQPSTLEPKGDQPSAFSLTFLYTCIEIADFIIVTYIEKTFLSLSLLPEFCLSAIELNHPFSFSMALCSAADGKWFTSWAFSIWVLAEWEWIYRGNKFSPSCPNSLKEM